MVFVISSAVLLVAANVVAAVPQDKDIERMDFIHKVKTNDAKPLKVSTCYKLLGVKWGSTPVSYVINPTNPQGLTTGFITSAISASAETWDASTSRELFNNNYTISASAQYGILDGKNAIAFGDYPSNSAIAVTSIWFNRRTKQITEFDQIYNTRFAWGNATANPSVMDLQNIATHELGHGAGLDDLYTSACTAVTMYGYSGYGETDKRTLETADITGLRNMYGA